MKNIIENNIILDENQIWKLPCEETFNYSDGTSSEKYLKRVFLNTDDLSSNSYDLEKWIKDWPSEYHLSRKRSQLLRGFDFKKSSKVLEVGCGCGAITRFLGETFDEVIAIEGSIERAKLARQRTKGMDNVSILCSPFQKIKFKQKFDIIFCIGVFEYSNIFVDAKDPYDEILKYFDKYLSNNGVIIIAIENQFGLKYFSSSTEDHTSVMFDGIEGYPRDRKKAKTFGYIELKKRLNKYFKKIDFYFPYPDYKIPSCVLSETFIDKTKVGELVGKFPSRDYLSKKNPLFDEKLALLELDKNNMLHYFSNSFLVIAGKNDVETIDFKQLGVMYTYNRIKKYQTKSMFVENKNGELRSQKMLINNIVNEKKMDLMFNRIDEKWVEGLSLNIQLYKKSKTNNIKLTELFGKCKIWLNTLRSYSMQNESKIYMHGKYIDCIWRNSIISNDKCYFIDQEWEWHEKINLKVIVIRSIYYFLEDIKLATNISPILRYSSTRKMIKKIAKSFQIDLKRCDFNEYCILESKIQSIINGEKEYLAYLRIKLILMNKRIYSFLKKLQDVVK